MILNKLKKILKESFDTLNDDITYYKNLKFYNKFSSCKFKTPKNIEYDINIFPTNINYDGYKNCDKELLNQMFNIDKPIPHIKFSVNGSFKDTNTNEPFVVVFYVFGFLRLYLNKFNNKVISYTPTENKRSGLYEYVLIKHFKDYKLIKDKSGVTFLVLKDLNKEDEQLQN